jgi:hypothetical protein
MSKFETSLSSGVGFLRTIVRGRGRFVYFFKANFYVFYQEFGNRRNIKSTCVRAKRHLYSFFEMIKY